MAVEMSEEVDIEASSSASDEDLESLTLMSSKLQPTTAAQRPPPQQATPSTATPTLAAPIHRKRSPHSISPSTISSDSSSPSPPPTNVAPAGLKAPPTPDEARLAAARIQRRRKCNKEQQMFRMKYRLLRETARSMVYENVALAQRVEASQNHLRVATQERAFLLERLLEHQASGAQPKLPNRRKEKRSVRRKEQTAAVSAGGHVGGRSAHASKGPSKKAHRQQPSTPPRHTSPGPWEVEGGERNSPRSGGKGDSVGKGKKGPVRKMQGIPLKEDGTPVFPIVIGTLKVLDLGYIVPDRPAFHSERYLLPVGYTSVRTYPSMHDPAKKCEYTCRILDGGEAPLFEMVAADDPSNPVQGSSSSQCHALVLKTINKARGRVATNTGSGPDFFGYGNPTIMNLIQGLANANQCTKYKRVQFEQSNRMAKGSIGMPTTPSIRGGRVGDHKKRKDLLSPAQDLPSREALDDAVLGLSPFSTSEMLFASTGIGAMNLSSPHMVDSRSDSDSNDSVLNMHGDL